MTTSDIEPGLHWPIKRSFIRYVARMDDGQILGGHGVHMLDSSTFVFPAGAKPLHFRGEVRLQAHNGALSLRIANPRVQPGPDRFSLLVDGIDGGARAVLLATCLLTGDPGVPGTWKGTDVRLAVEAVDLFGGYYGEGEAFDDFLVVEPVPGLA